MAEFNANAFGAANSRVVHQQQWFHLTMTPPGGDGTVLELSAQSLPLFTEGNEVVEVHFGNSKAYQAGKATFEGGSFTFMDLVDSDTRGQLYAWRESVYDRDSGAIHGQESYKCNVTVTLFKYDNQVHNSWVLHGAWPSSVNWGQLDYNSTDKSSVEVTITFDWGEKVR